MRIDAKTPEAYIQAVTPEHRDAIIRLRETVLSTLPEGFAEIIQYSMLSYVVPHALYPAGYHVTPSEPQPFIAIASQKRHIALYHMGLQLFPDVLTWFEQAYRELGIGKLDMGRSCIRFANSKKIPFALIAQLSGKITPAQMIGAVEMAVAMPKK